jgi:hypothetical protein
MMSSPNIDHHQAGEDEHPKAPGQVAGLLRLLEGGDQVRQGHVVHTTARLRVDHVFLALQEAERVEAFQLLALDAGLEGEVEVAQGLDRGEPGAAHVCLEPAADWGAGSGRRALPLRPRLQRAGRCRPAERCYRALPAPRAS